MRIIATILLALFAMANVSVAALAQDFPSKPITLIVPYPPGGGTDIAARTLAAEMSADLGQPIVVQNRAGASGKIGLQALTMATPDGYTIMAMVNTIVIGYRLRNEPLDLDKALTPVGNTLRGPLAVLVNPSVIDVRTLPELIDHLRKHPDTSYASAAPGSGGHLVMELMAQELGLKMTHIGYSGAAPAAMAAIARDIGMVVLDGPTASPHVTSGALRAIVVVSSFRSSLMPEVPTTAELGYPAISNDALQGVAAPPGMPKLIVDRLAAAVKKASASTKFVEGLERAGQKPEFIDGPGFSALLKNDYERWGRVIEAAGIKGQ
jgi:tripartite-type tricarboxylate transporter receptor subunit TctC